MSTNYYGLINPCKCCGKADKTLHLGKETCKEFISNYNKDELTIAISLSDKIHDEYGTNITKSEIITIINELIIRTIKGEFC